MTLDDGIYTMGTMDDGITNHNLGGADMLEQELDRLQIMQDVARALNTAIQHRMNMEELSEDDPDRSKKIEKADKLLSDSRWDLKYNMQDVAADLGK